MRRALILDFRSKFRFIIAKLPSSYVVAAACANRRASEVYVCVALKFVLRLQSIRRVVTCRRLIVPIHVAISSCRAPCPIGNFTLSLSPPSPLSRHRSLLPFYFDSPFVSCFYSYRPFCFSTFSLAVDDYTLLFSNLTSKKGCN